MVKTHLRGLDGLRGLAALSVLVYHVSVFAPPPKGSWVADVVGVGWVGVDVFFAISGFILFLPFARADAATGPPVSLRRYATNRTRRILPAYLFNLFALVTLGIASVLHDWRGLRIVAANLTFTAGYLGLPQVNGVYWTLFCEVAFYLTLPFLARALSGRRWVVGIPALLAASWLYKAVVISALAPPGPRAELRQALEQFPGVLDQFVVGMLAALVWVALERRGVQLRAATCATIAVVALAAIPTLLWVLQDVVTPSHYWAGDGAAGWLPLVLLKPLLSLAAAAAIVGVCASDNVVTRVLELGPLRYLGAVSFGVYLWHLPLSKLLGPALPLRDHQLRHFALALVVVGLAALGWAALSHQFVEKPFLRRRAPVPTTDEDTERPAPPLVRTARSRAAR